MSASTINMIKIIFMVSVTMSAFNSSDCQITTIANGIPQIISLLENVTNTSAAMSSILPQMTKLLKNQDDAQLLTNLLFENHTATAYEVVSVLTEMQRLMQRNQNDTMSLFQSTLDQIVNIQQQEDTHLDEEEYVMELNSNEVHQDQPNTENQVISLLEAQIKLQTINHNVTNDLTRTQLAKQDQIVNILQAQLETKQEGNETLNIHDTLVQMATTQLEMAQTQNQTSNILTQISDTQSRMANAFNQVVTLLQMQDQHLQNMTTTLTQMVSTLEGKQETIGTTSPSATTVAPCPETWLLYRGHCYRYFSISTTWTVARDHCRGLGGDLASIHSAEENSIIYGLISSDVWIGGNDMSREGDFQWSDGSRFGFTNWYYPQPDNSNNEDCVHLLYRSDPTYAKKWNDLTCNDANHFMCKM
ncbi:uncharacterized protein [Amphiura filiformis]|uniref:uncharacterized protein n=1 Tax=Amphiura filiformis TaxID=82378 RepID=UPI003B21FCC6